MTGIYSCVITINRITETKKMKLRKVYNLLVIDKVTDGTPQCSFQSPKLKIPGNIVLSDPHLKQSSEIDLLLEVRAFL